MTASPTQPTRRIAACVVLAALAVGCQPKTRRTPDDTLVVVIPAIVRDMDPRFAITNHDVKLSRLVAPGLTTTDPDSLEPVNELAESIVAIDARTWEVTLRDGLLFSDGTPVTTDDVAWTYSSVMEEATNSLYQKQFAERFARFEIIDERTLRFHTHEPLATFLSDLDFGIISRAAATDDGRFPDGHVIGAGPFRITGVQTERIRWERNPHYYGTPAVMGKVELRTVRDTNARALMLIGGSADFAQNAIRVDLVDDVAARDRVYLETGHSSIQSYLMMHNDDEILSDVRVRRAIAHSIDRERIISAKFQGRAVLATGLLPPGHWAYEPDVIRYDFDRDKAMALLDEAGYPDPDGPGGQPRMKLTYKTSADQFRLAVARIIAAQLAEVGIEVEVRSFEFGTFFDDIKRGNYQIASMQTSEISEPDYYYAYYNSSRIPTAEEPNKGNNRWRYRNERVDRLTTEGRSETNRDRRLELYRGVQQQIAEDVPVVPLWHEDNVAVLNADVYGYSVTPNARYNGLVTVGKRP